MLEAGLQWPSYQKVWKAKTTWLQAAFRIVSFSNVVADLSSVVIRVLFATSVRITILAKDELHCKSALDFWEPKTPKSLRPSGSEDFDESAKRRFSLKATAFSLLRFLFFPMEQNARNRGH